MQPQRVVHERMEFLNELLNEVRERLSNRYTLPRPEEVYLVHVEEYLQEQFDLLMETQETT